ncbi:hypothetical protein BFJ66_g16550 [Fusarium oxysporum f. sp. cepae]|nr:hypothetical protein BFJ66_g16550 [Fusarium oxysporum f. sp. cepae]
MPFKKGPVFRVTGLPVEQPDEELNTKLRAAIGDNLSDEEKSQLSFTATVIPSCYNDLERVALVEFHGGVPGFLSDLVANPLEDWAIEMGDIDINFDQHFLGFTQLYTPKPDAPVTADIIAITGLDGHPYGSWRGKGNLGRMWLRDFLSKDLPCCRTMIYGYNSKLSSHGIDTIMDYGRELIEELKKVRNSDELRQRPVFFIAHSFGGIILAHCLIKAVQTNEEDHPTIATLHRATYGMLLFGIPHKGLVVDDIQKMLAGEGNHPRSVLLQQIREKSDLLAFQLADFKNLIRDRKIVSFYETGQTKQLEFNNETKRWERTGSFVTAVETDSALLQLPDSMEEKIPLDSDHSMIVKFDNKNQRGYTSALDKLRQFEQDAPIVVAARLTQHGKQSAGVTFLVPYTENPNFVDRPEIFEKLKLQLGFGQRLATANTQLRVSLYGLGGVGKTQIALAYIYWLRQKHPDVSVFWVHASSEERFRQSYASIADECNIPRRDDPKVNILVLVKEWLTKRFKRQWLMVIDNADDTQIFFHLQQETVRPQCERLGHYIPECAHGSILVTTRNKQAGSRLARGKPPIEVGNMTNHETNELVRTMLENNDIPDEEISGLATRLENLPLALAQAASFIHENGITIDDYIVLLDTSDIALVECLSEPFETVGRDSDTPHAVTATWIISFEQIQKQDRFAGEVLSLISLLHRQTIPREFITNHWQRKRVAEANESSQEVRVTKALGTLKAFCVVSEAKDHSLDMHRLVQLVARKWLVMKGKMEEFAQHALKTVSDIYPYGEFETREVCLKYLPHAHAVLENESTGLVEGREERARLLHCVAGYFDYEGRWKEAEQYQIGAVKLRTEVLGEEHPDTLTSMGNLASIYSNQGRWKEAEELGVDVMEIRKRVLGEEHPYTLTSMGNLASTYWNQGRWKEAEELEVDVMEISKRVLGEEHPDTLTSMEELEVDVMEISKRVLGEEHPDTLASMANLALTYQNQGHWKEAEELEVDVMEISKRVLGEEHPDTLTSMGNLASTYRNQGHWKEAEELEVDVMEIRKRVLGEEHPYTLTSMGNLASTYWNQGRWKEAEELEVDVMEIRKRVLGEEHPYTLTSMNNLAFTWKDSGRTKDALALMRCCVVLQQRVLGIEHPHTTSLVTSLAEWESTNDSS